MESANFDRSDLIDEELSTAKIENSDTGTGFLGRNDRTAKLSDATLETSPLSTDGSKEKLKPLVDINELRDTFYRKITSNEVDRLEMFMNIYNSIEESEIRDLDLEKFLAVYPQNKFLLDFIEIEKSFANRRHANGNVSTILPFLSAFPDEIEDPDRFISLIHWAFYSLKDKKIFSHYTDSLSEHTGYELAEFVEKFTHEIIIFASRTQDYRDFIENGLSPKVKFAIARLHGLV